MENWKEIFASFGLWSLVDDISDDGDGQGDNLQLTKDGELFVSEIQQELDRAREEGKLYALDNLKDYIFINDTHRNKDLPLTWDDLRHYIKEVEQIYSEKLSKLTTK